MLSFITGKIIILKELLEESDKVRLVNIIIFLMRERADVILGGKLLSEDDGRGARMNVFSFVINFSEESKR